MFCPKDIFIDTSVFDGQAYNFASSAFTSFHDASKDKGLTLLLPDPIKREIRKHISDNARDALKALREAKRKAPFVSKWDQWPKERGEWISEYDLRKLAERELSDFLKKFRMIELGYEEVRLSEVMDWYHEAKAPFGSKKGKQKEFPDALAVAALVAYARREKKHVAVISSDSDFQGACAYHSELLYFPSLAAITEALLASDQLIAEIKKVVGVEASKLIAGIKEDFVELSFYPDEDPEGEVEDVDVQDVEIDDLKVVSLGHHECTVA
jgi:hypothetical protein